MSEIPATITVGELRRQIESYADNAEIYFGDGNLSFFRIRPRSSRTPQLLQMEFKEMYHVEPYK